MLEGWAYGLLDHSETKVDIDFFKEKLREPVSRLAVKEKEPFEADIRNLSQLVESKIRYCVWRKTIEV